jgi:hypothetical protein
MEKPKGREIYSASLLLLIGTIYLVAQADSFFSIASIYVEGDVIKLSKNEFLSHLRTVITIILCFCAGILLLRLKRSGWIISQSLLVLLLSIAIGIFISNFSGFSLSFIALAVAIFLLLIAIIFLLLNPTRQKFMVSGKDYLYTIFLFVILALFYFYLQ